MQRANPEDGGETYVLIDQVVYQTTDPWPVLAGRALQRVSESVFGSVATSWNLEVPSPGEYGPTAASDGDFDGNGLHECADIDAMVVSISRGENRAEFDLSGDGVVDSLDVDRWLAQAGAANLPSKNPFLAGDINLDGIVNVHDLNVLAQSWLMTASGWCAGDITPDGLVNAADLNKIGMNWLANAAGDSMMPARGPRAALAIRAEHPVVTAMTRTEPGKLGPQLDSPSCESARLQTVANSPHRVSFVSRNAERERANLAEESDSREKLVDKAIVDWSLCFSHQRGGRRRLPSLDGRS